VKNQRTEIKDIRCKGRMPENRKPCEAVLYQSDGEFLYLNGHILNSKLKAQYIICRECGYEMKWKQNKGFQMAAVGSGNKCS
jgi:hypothetical protein